MAQEDGFQALLGMEKEGLVTRNYRRGGLEAELEQAIILAERATAKAVAVRALISKFPEVIEAEKKYDLLAREHRIYPVDPNRNYEPTDPEGCAEAVGFCDFHSQKDFELMMGTAISLKEAYDAAQNKCYGWEYDIRTGAADIAKNSERNWWERLERAKRIGTEATFIIPELVKFLKEDIGVYLRSATVQGLDTSKYASVVKKLYNSYDDPKAKDSSQK